MFYAIWFFSSSLYLLFFNLLVYIARIHTTTSDSPFFAQFSFGCEFVTGQIIYIVCIKHPKRISTQNKYAIIIQWYAVNWRSISFKMNIFCCCCFIVVFSYIVCCVISLYRSQSIVCVSQDEIKMGKKPRCLWTNG